MKEKFQIESALNDCLSLEGRLEEYITLIELGIEESDEEVIFEGISSLENLLKQLTAIDNLIKK